MCPIYANPLFSRGILRLNKVSEMVNFDNLSKLRELLDFKEVLYLVITFTNIMTLILWALGH